MRRKWVLGVGLAALVGGTAAGQFASDRPLVATPPSLPATAPLGTPKATPSSWTLHMASIIIFATIWGVLLKEWRGASPRAMRLLRLGVATLLLSTIIVGYGNYLGATP